MPDDFKEKLWEAANELKGDMDTAEYKRIVLGLILLKYLSDTFEKQQEKVGEMVSEPGSDDLVNDGPGEYKEKLKERDFYAKDHAFWVPKNVRWASLRAKAKQPDIGSVIDNAMTLIENENPSLKGKLDKHFGSAELGEGALGGLIDLISTIRFAEEYASSDLLGEVYEYFLGRFASDEGKKDGEFYTPSHVVKILVAALAPTSGSVYDPCCGTGGTFVQSEEFVKSHGGRTDDISLYGQESDPTIWRLAAMNLAIRGISADLGKEPANTFARDQFPDLKFDYIMANPPLKDSHWDSEYAEDGPRWQFGIPPARSADCAWMQHALWKLRPGGQAGLVLRNDTTYWGIDVIDGKIREAMIRNDMVEVMVSISDHLFLNSQPLICLWFLTNDKTAHGRDRRGETLLIEADNLGTKIGRWFSVLSDEDVAKVTDTIQAWKSGNGYEDVEGFCKSASFSEIAKKNFSLSAGIYVDRFPAEDNSDAFILKINQLTERLEGINEQKSKLKQAISDGDPFIQKTQRLTTRLEGLNTQETKLKQAMSENMERFSSGQE